MSYPKLIETLIEQLTKLPGIGRRSAERIVFWLLSQTPEDATALTDSITALKNNLMFCRECNNFSEAETCGICRDATRDRSSICVVENPKDVLAVEKTGAYKGLYHILL
jgi:recombination protein RecR